MRLVQTRAGPPFQLAVVIASTGPCVPDGSSALSPPSGIIRAVPVGTHVGRSCGQRPDATHIAPTATQRAPRPLTGSRPRRRGGPAKPCTRRSEMRCSSAVQVSGSSGRHTAETKRGERNMDATRLRDARPAPCSVRAGLTRALVLEHALCEMNTWAHGHRGHTQHMAIARSRDQACSHTPSSVASTWRLPLLRNSIKPTLIDDRSTGPPTRYNT